VLFALQGVKISQETKKNQRSTQKRPSEKRATKELRRLDCGVSSDAAKAKGEGGWWVKERAGLSIKKDCKERVRRKKKETKKKR